MAHEIRPFERTRDFVAWLETFGWRVLGELQDPVALSDLGPWLLCVHGLPWGGPRWVTPCVWRLWSALVHLHARLYSPSYSPGNSQPM